LGVSAGAGLAASAAGAALVASSAAALASVGGAASACAKARPLADANSIIIAVKIAFGAEDGREDSWIAMPSLQ
jgi:hypothetical protein